MDKPKCKLCGERHWGACDHLVEPIPVAVSSEAIQRQMRHEGMEADTSSATKQPKRTAKPRDLESAMLPTHPPTHQSKYAPLGECPYCDRQRALNAKAVSLHRASKRREP
jgi:hypothetical protein